jgi:hypothetical protein
MAEDRFVNTVFPFSFIELFHPVWLENNGVLWNIAIVILQYELQYESLNRDYLTHLYSLSHTRALQYLWGGAQWNTGYGEFREKAKKSVGYEAQPVECCVYD